MTTPPEPGGIRYVSGVMLDTEGALTLNDALAIFVELLRAQGSRPTAKLQAVRAQLASAVRTDVGVSDSGRDTLARVSKLTDAPGPGTSSDREEFIGTDVAAELLGCTVSNVRYLARRGALPGQSVGGRWLVDRAAVEERAARG
ncbi:helix-turn-helix domain-containing protein [Rhodococcoides yunnanense]|uniref:helix-turn-helix domain-containing protein n=1 Tax=Rhodococcoides yunnanense TaxID=278209 RepID=UPI0022B08D1D|nr:helix-turn-helix domain-containing protein [Rhodococcus yunnanensis]MCZ4278474.1 helix-turn-helix domain-containing protein [Rhodococcus yunnanensis]